ncbi:MAG TPA: hypothetical protein VM677_17865 [Actinokineospora sp.]|nr:hypothetical protein [Actinokineospora sp.]
MPPVPFDQGDLGAVFPEVTGETAAAITAALRRIADRIEQFAADLGGDADSPGCGLEIAGVDLTLRVDFDDVAFGADLDTPRDPMTFGAAPPPPWSLRAAIEVRCAEPADCGMHAIEEWRDADYDDPLEAALGLEQAVEWLIRRGREEPLGRWRERDPRHPAR